MTFITVLQASRHPTRPRTGISVAYERQAMTNILLAGEISNKYFTLRFSNHI